MARPQNHRDPDSTWKVGQHLLYINANELEPSFKTLKSIATMASYFTAATIVCRLSYIDYLVRLLKNTKILSLQHH